MSEHPDFMDKHFEFAGVTAESNPDENGTNAAPSGSNTSEVPASSADTQDGSPGLQTPAKDSTSGTSDSGAQPGQEEKGKSPPGPEDGVPAGGLKLKDGTLVQPGAERRYFDERNLARQQLTLAKQDLNTANQKYQTLETRYNELNETVKKFGFEDPTTVSSAIELYKDFIKDPVTTVKELLAVLTEKGYKIDGIGSGVDTTAILNAINRNTPKGSEQATEPSSEEVLAEVQKELNDFFTDFPDAAIHDGIISAIIDSEAEKGNVDISLREIYFGLKQSAIERGLDWSKPLGPQMEAQRKAKTTPTQAPNNPSSPAPRAPTSTIAEGIDFSKETTSSGDDTEEIIRAAMRENGMRV